MPSTLHRAHAAWVGCASLVVTIVSWCSVVHAFHDSDDWLLDTLPAPATLTPVGPCRLALSNGLLSRVFAVPGPGCDQAAPNWATCECACVRASACSTFMASRMCVRASVCVLVCVQCMQPLSGWCTSTMEGFDARTALWHPSPYHAHCSWIALSRSHSRSHAIAQ
jgi:hypothetical protein